MLHIAIGRLEWSGSQSVCLSVGLSVALQKRLNSIEMPFAVWTWPKEACVRKGPDLSMQMGNFEGKGLAYCKLLGHSIGCAKMAEPIEMQSGMWT